MLTRADRRQAHMPDCSEGYSEGGLG